MRKIKQLSLILFLSFGFFACEAEKVNEDLVNNNFQGKQIFRCEIDGVTRVTDSVQVTTTGATIQIKAHFLSVLPEEAVKYKYDTFVIGFNKLATGNYISSLGNLIVDESLGFSTASYKYTNKTWYYSTDNLEINYTGNPADLLNMNIQTGSLSIDNINEKAKYFGGNFSYDVYPPKNQNPNNSVPPIRIRNGFFQYIKFD